MIIAIKSIVDMYYCSIILLTIFTDLQIIITINYFINLLCVL